MLEVQSQMQIKIRELDSQIDDSKKHTTKLQQECADHWAQVTRLKLEVCFVGCPLIVNGLYPPPPHCKKFVKKTANAINMIFYKCYQNPLTTFKTICETLSALGACHVTIMGGVVYKKPMIFEVF